MSSICVRGRGHFVVAMMMSVCHLSIGGLQDQLPLRFLHPTWQIRARA